MHIYVNISIPYKLEPSIPNLDNETVVCLLCRREDEQNKLRKTRETFLNPNLLHSPTCS